MKRILLTLLLVLLLLIGGAALWIGLVFDPNDYRDDIAQRFAERSGRELLIEGDLKVAFFPWLGIETGPIVLNQRDGSDDRPFARIESARIFIKPLALLRGRLEMGALTLDGLLLNLTRDASGRGNWEDLQQRMRDGGDRRDGREGDRGGEHDPLQLALLGGVKVRNATLNWEDLAAGRRVSIRDIALESDAPRGDAPLEAKLQATFDLVGVDGLRGEAALAADMEIALRAGEGAPVRLSAVQVAGSVEGAGFARPLPFSLSARGTLDPRRQEARLEGVKLNVDRSAAVGSASVSGFDAPMIRFALKMAELDIDRYRTLPPGDAQRSGKAGRSAAAPSGAVAAGVMQLPTAQLRALRLDGRIDIERLQMFGAELTKAEVKIDADGGVVRINPLQANLYGGRISGDLRIDASGNGSPRIAFDRALQGVAVGPLLQALTGREWLTGTLAAHLKGSARGDDVAQLKRTLSADGAVELRDGALFGFDLERRLRQGLRLLESRPVADEQRTNFAELTATVRVRDGVLRSDDLQAAATLFDLTGAGVANLVDETLDWRLKMRMRDDLAAVPGLKRLEGRVIPVHIFGPFAAPQAALDMGAAISGEVDRIKRKAQKKIEKKIEEEIGDRLGDALKGLF